MQETETKKRFDVNKLLNGWEHHFYFLHPITQFRRCQYYYRHTDGVLFSTIGKSWGDCLKKREAWLVRTGRKLQQK